jgi:hypothetical protein
MSPMKRSGRGAWLFGLGVLALSLMIFGVATAQAEGIWMVKGKNLASSAFNENKELTGSIVAPNGTLLSTLGLNKVDFSCTAGELLNAKLEQEGAISEFSKNAKVDFKGCTTKINGVTAKACEPKATGKAAGTIETEAGYALLALHALSESEKDGVVVITPAVGNVFAVIHMGEACTIGEAVKVFGSLALKDSGGNGGLEEEKVTHTFEEFAPLTALKVANESSEGKASLDGKAEVKLTSGEVWNGLAK